MAGVDSFHHDHPLVVAELLIELAVPDVDGVDAGGAALKQAIGESAGRGADVEADQAGRVYSEGVERVGQLAAGARDERLTRSQNGDASVLSDGR